jgi:LysM repeat protein
MTRKDTIIIAILVNAALLVALFVSALKKDSAQTALAATPPPPAIEKPIEAPKVEPQIIKASSGDEVDRVLKEFVQSRPVAAAVPQEPVSLASDPFAAFAPPPQAVSEKKEEKSDIIEWVVKKGDALEKIAKAHRTSVEEIMRLNSLKNSALRVGQVLKVQSHKVASAPDKTPAPAKQPSAAKYYTVKTGDNPWTIAVKNHLKVEDLLKLNNLDAEKARHLKPGDELRIR